MLLPVILMNVLKGKTGRYSNLPVCVAKTQYSLSNDAECLGQPSGFLFPVREVKLAAGAGFVLVLAEGITLMPELPREPAACRIGRVAKFTSLEQGADSGSQVAVQIRLLCPSQFDLDDGD